ncbi:MAG: CheR family methyltransferase [Solirubrobacteraceae bacterium]
MTDDLRALAAVVERMSGVVVRDVQLTSLHAALARVDPRLTAADLLRDADPALLERLVDQVAVKETFFLRHVEELRDIDWRTMAARAAAAGRPLRIWSAGCSTGEEPYSLAILAAEALGGDLPAMHVLGSDLSASALARAELGLYGPRSMRLVDRACRQRWFVADGDQLRVGARLRGLVRFARHNLVGDSYPPAGEVPFDLIVCRNFLIYFDAPVAARVTTGLRASLAPGARLLLGTVDQLGSAPRPAVATTRPRQAARLGRDTPAGPAAAPVAATRRLHPDSGVSESAVEAAHAAFEAGSQALGGGDPTSAVHALRRALYLDPRRAVVALQLARAHEALDDVDAARRAYRRALRLVAEAPAPGGRVYDRVVGGDVAAACRARLAVLPESGAGTRSRLIEP